MVDTTVPTHQLRGYQVIGNEADQYVEDDAPLEVQPLGDRTNLPSSGVTKDAKPAHKMLKTVRSRTKKGHDGENVEEAVRREQALRR